MYRLCYLGHQWYAYRFSSLENEAENIEQLSSEGTPVLICHDLDEACDLLDIEEDEIQMAN